MLFRFCCLQLGEMFSILETGLLSHCASLTLTFLVLGFYLEAPSVPLDYSSHATDR